MPCPVGSVQGQFEGLSRPIIGQPPAMMGTRPSEWLSQQLDNGKDILLLDCRPPNDYNVSHIQGAIHVAIPTLMQRRLKKGNLAVSSVISCAEGKEKFDSKWRKEVLIVYDECTSDMNSNTTSVVGLLLKRLKEDGCRVYLLQGGFASFKEKYPQHCAGLKEGSTPEDSAIFGLRNLQLTETTENGGPDEETPNAVVFPVKVLPNLFLGNAKNASDLECLDKNGIKYILNVTVDVPNTFENDPDIKYMQIPISDHWSQNLSTFFPKAIAFIEEGRSKNCGVLVHCLAGISRSVTVTVAYLMYSKSLSLNDAYDFVKTVKPNISPNFNFLGQLQDFERQRQRQTSGGECECECKDRSSPDSAADSPCRCSSPKYYFSSPTNCTPTQTLATTPS